MTHLPGNTQAVFVCVFPAVSALCIRALNHWDDMRPAVYCSAHPVLQTCISRTCYYYVSSFSAGTKLLHTAQDFDPEVWQNARAARTAWETIDGRRAASSSFRVHESRSGQSSTTGLGDMTTYGVTWQKRACHQRFVWRWMLLPLTHCFMLKQDIMCGFVRTIQVCTLHMLESQCGLWARRVF